MRELDRATIETVGLPGMVLMERAALASADAIQARAPDGRVAVLIGPGNNGGDGSALARLLFERGRDVVRVESAPRERLRGDALANARIADALGVACSGDAASALAGASVWVDALLGIGQREAPRGAVAELLRVANEERRAGRHVVVALDVPTGVSADTGAVWEPHALAADLTVTFGHRKWGHVLPPALDWVGEVLVAPIGTADALLPADAPYFVEAEPSALMALWRRPSRAAHKNEHGHVVVLGGARPTLGAGVLSARAALRSGAGLVTLATDPSLAPALVSVDAALMATDRDSLLDDERARALVAGPGWGLDERAGRRLRELSDARTGAPWVWDADAITWLGRWGEPRVQPNDVLTPHPGELGRLLDLPTSAVLADLPSAARAAQARWGGTVVAKTAGAIVAGSDGLRFVPPGAAGAGSAGSGDVLAGVIGGLLTRHAGFDAATLGAGVHALASAAARVTCGDTALCAGDLVSHLGHAFRELERDGSGEGA